MTDRIGIVYVFGTPRSASTVTGDLLSSLDGVEHLGEIRVPLDFGLDSIRANPRRTCGCGRPAGSCPFWSTLEVDDGAPRDLRYGRILAHAGAVLDAELVVDSSKTLGGLRLAHRSGALRGIVLCRRDLRGFLRSRRAHAAEQVGPLRRWVSVGPDVVRWVVNRALQLLVATLARRRGIGVGTTSPATVVSDPSALRESLATSLLGRPAGSIEPGIRTFHTGPTHAVWGSPSRIRPDGELVIVEASAPGATRRPDEPEVSRPD